MQDDENAKLSAKIKELEEDRARLQRTTSIQQTQIEKHRALAEESAKKSDGLQLQVSGLLKVCVAAKTLSMTDGTANCSNLTPSSITHAS